MRIALDTNVLAYAEGVDDATRMEIVTTLVAALPPEAIVIPTQVLGELLNVLTRKAGRAGVEARAMVLIWQDSYTTAPTTPEVMSAAMDLAATHQLRIWDAVILAAAERAGCRRLLSEDMQHGL